MEQQALLHECSTGAARGAFQRHQSQALVSLALNAGSGTVSRRLIHTEVLLSQLHLRPQVMVFHDLGWGELTLSTGRPHSEKPYENQRFS